MKYSIFRENLYLFAFMPPLVYRETSAQQSPWVESLFIKRIPIWKRSIDIAGSLIGLLLLFPILLLISIYIKVVSSGPVLFTQERIGCGGIPFNIFKFRTMHRNADQGLHQQYLSDLIQSSNDNRQPGNPMGKLREDRRIIKYGQILRAFGLDELPQLINVLMGQMSLVGPRPAIAYEVSRYQLWFRGRFDVTPGLTGLWQVSGKNRLGYNEMIRLDIQYAQKRSFLLDLKILLKTPMAVLKQIGDLKKGRC